MKKILALLLFSTLYISSFSQNLTIDQKVDSLLNLMTLDEKIGQMTQVERGMLESQNDISYYSIGSLLSGGGSSPSPNTQQAWADMYDEFQEIALQSRLGIPLIYGVDAVHGHNNVYGAVISPHNIGLGCTWNPELVKSINEITAKEVAATGIDWTFAPCITVPQDERWGRTYEGFGETAEITKIMSKASVEGLQNYSLESPETILACAKHFVGDGGTTNGDDQGNTEVSEEVLRDLHMAGYLDAIDAKVGSIMASYSSWNGQKMHGNAYLLTDVLKDELGFEGFIVSDWAGVDQIAGDYREAVKKAINAGIDMVMVPDRYIYFISILKSLVEDNEVNQERIDDAVRRILKQKFLLNLFEEPMTNPEMAADFGSEAHRDVARQAVRESLVLLNAKNDILPLQKDNQRIMVAGEKANDLGALCGGWSISWQGSNGNITEGTNILQGLQNAAGSSEIIYSPNGDISNNIDVAVVVIGENPYAEGAGDRETLNMDESDIDLIQKIKENGIPVVAVLVSGRPLILSEALPYTDAFIAAWLPGSEGGNGIADILFGNNNPSGKTSFSWPKDMNHFPVNFGDPDYQPLFAYKHGLNHFPSHANSDFFSPYAANISEDGNAIYLYLADDITSVEDAASVFTVKLNGVQQNGLVSQVDISEIDETLLVLQLNNNISENDGEVSLSYHGNSIYSSDLTLAEFDDLYVFSNATGGGGGQTNYIPGIVQAENFYDMMGIQTEECTDAGGGLNVGYIESGDWMKYQVIVSNSGIYKIRSRTAGFAAGSFTLDFGNGTETTISHQSTNGWQNWQDFYSDEFYLSEGNYTMTFTANNNAFNVNYFEFDLVNSIDEIEKNIVEIKLSPNPAQRIFNLDFEAKKHSKASIKFYDMSGKQIQNLYEGEIYSGANKFSFQIDSEIQAGMYFIEIKDEYKRYFEKLMVE